MEDDLEKYGMFIKFFEKVNCMQDLISIKD